MPLPPHTGTASCPGLPLVYFLEVKGVGGGREERHHVGTHYRIKAAFARFAVKEKGAAVSPALWLALRCCSAEQLF